MPPKFALAAGLAAVLSLPVVGAFGAPVHGKPIRIDTGRAPSGGKWGFAAQQFGERGACARLRMPNRSYAQACRLPGRPVMEAAVGTDPCGDTYVIAVTTRGVARVGAAFAGGRRRRATRYAPPEGIHYRGRFYLAIVKGVHAVRRIRARDSSGRTVALVTDVQAALAPCPS